MARTRIGGVALLLAAAILAQATFPVIVHRHRHAGEALRSPRSSSHQECPGHGVPSQAREPSNHELPPVPARDDDCLICRHLMQPSLPDWQVAELPSLEQVGSIRVQEPATAWVAIVSLHPPRSPPKLA